MIRENEMKATSGWLMLTVLLVTAIGSCTMVVRSIPEESPWMTTGWLLLAGLAGSCLPGLTVVNPNEAKVVQLLRPTRPTKAPQAHIDTWMRLQLERISQNAGERKLRQVAWTNSGWRESAHQIGAHLEMVEHAQVSAYPGDLAPL